MGERALAARLRRLSARTVLDREIRVALGFRARLLGLAFLDRERAGPGLLIPRCSSVHTLGMRFPLDLVFLDGEGAAIAVHRRVGRGRVVRCRAADAVLEFPAGDDPAARLIVPVANLVGEEGEATDLRLQGVGEANERRVARIADAALQAADVRQMNARAIGERFLA